MHCLESSYSINYSMADSHHFGKSWHIIKLEIDTIVVPVVITQVMSRASRKFYQGGVGESK